MNGQDPRNVRISIIPTEHYEPPRRLHLPVTGLPDIRFDLPGMFGVGLRGARVAFLQGLVLGSEDSALELVGGVETIKVAIHWPGYEGYEVEKKIEIRTAQGVLTRAMLGEQVATKVIEVISVLMRCTHRSTEKRWEVRHDRVNYSNIYLIGLSNIHEGCWKVDLYTTFMPSQLRQVEQL